MAKPKNVTDAEVIACHVAAEPFLFEMRDFADRIQKGYADRIEDAPDAARNFALIAEAAAKMATQLLILHEMQKLKDETSALRAKLGQ